MCVDMCIYISHVSWKQIFLQILLLSIQNLFFVTENEGEKLVNKTNLTPNVSLKDTLELPWRLLHLFHMMLLMVLRGDID